MVQHIELCLQWPTNRKSYNDLSNGAIFNDLEWPLPQFQGHAILWRRISHKWYEIHIVQWNTNRDLHTLYSTVSFRMTLSYLDWRSKIFSDKKRRAVSLRQLSFLYRNNVGLIHTVYYKHEAYTLRHSTMCIVRSDCEQGRINILWCPMHLPV